MTPRGGLLKSSTRFARSLPGWLAAVGLSAGMAHADLPVGWDVEVFAGRVLDMALHEGVIAGATDVLKGALEKKSFTIEKTFESGITDTYFRFTGCRTGQLDLNFTANEFVTGRLAYTGGNGDISINQTNVDAVIGDANYDIGHVFNTGSGLASLGVVGVSGFKARGTTGIGSPVNDPFTVDYVAHEMGHQYGGDHTNSCE